MSLNISADRAFSPLSIRDVEAGEQASLVLINAFSAIVAVLLVYFFYMRFIVELYVMPKMFKRVYLDLTVQNQRSYTAHFLWLTVKLTVVPCVWPFVNVFIRGKSIEAPLFHGALISNADWLSVAYVMIIAMFLFEIIYRLKISGVSLLHHVAGCALSSWTIAEQVGNSTEDTDAQFRILILYGVFEIFFETFPHFTVLYYRCQPKNSYGFAKTSRMWLLSAISSLCGTTLEFIAMAVFMWRNWKYWGLGSRVALPILHFAFMAAQIHGARVGFQLWKEFQNRSRNSLDEESEVGRESKKDLSVETTVGVGQETGIQKAPNLSNVSEALNEFNKKDDDVIVITKTASAEASTFETGSGFGEQRSRRRRSLQPTPSAGSCSYCARKHDGLPLYPGR